MKEPVKITCPECKRPFFQSGRANPQRYCSAACRQKAYRRRFAAQIRRINAIPDSAIPRTTDEMQAERIAAVNAITSQYPTADPAIVYFAVVACERTSTPIQYFIDRVLEGNRNIPRNEAFAKEFKSQLQLSHKEQWRIAWAEILS
jgi:hypothetical protein